MKATTLKSRMQSRYNGSKSRAAYRMVTAVIDGKNEKGVYKETIRPCYASGMGRFWANLDYTAEVISLLNLIGVKFITGNDAPRGSATGNWIKVTTKIER